MASVTLNIWKTERGLHLKSPDEDAVLMTISFDPDSPCEVCGEPVLNISMSGTHICPWCDSGVNRPKMLPYQHEQIKQQLLSSVNASVAAEVTVPCH